MGSGWVFTFSVYIYVYSFTVHVYIYVLLLIHIYTPAFKNTLACENTLKPEAIRFTRSECLSHDPPLPFLQLPQVKGRFVQVVLRSSWCPAQECWAVGG